MAIKIRVEKVNNGKYERLKQKLLKDVNKFEFSDDLVHLIKVMDAGTRILKLNDFPFNKWKKYKKLYA